MNLFNFIKEKVSILDLVSSYTSLKRAGVYWKGSCPFHSEKTASFTVSPHKGIFYCFGCHEGGDVVTFIGKVENITPLEAAKHLADRYGIELPKNIELTSTPEDIDKKKRYWKAYELVSRWCHNELKANPIALAYLTNRSLSPAIIDLYEIGYFPGGPKKTNALLALCQAEGIMLADLLEAEILAQSKTVIYSPFEERIIFPITDHLGRHCAFGGRIFKPEDERPKYYNSRETDYFIKGSTLFGFEHAKKSLQEKNNVILVEGYTDCIAMAQHGYLNTVATLGTACTIEHLKILARYVEVVYVLFDGDEAGKKAMLRLVDLCWQVNLDLKIISLPTGDDPASFLTAGNRLEPLVDKAEDIFIFVLRALGTDFPKKPLAQKLRLTRRIIELFQTIEEPLKQDLLMQEAAKIFGIPFQILKDELGRSPAQALKNDMAALQHLKNDPSVALKDLSGLEKKLFSVIINNIELAQREDVALLIDYFSPVLKNLLKRIQELMLRENSCTFNDLYSTLDTSEQQLVSYLLIEFQENDVNEVEQLIVQFQKQHWKSLVVSFQHKLAHAQEHKDQAATQQLISEFQSLKQRLLSRGT